jgi:outer membrane lipoprotein-sorting protein
MKALSLLAAFLGLLTAALQAQTTPDWSAIADWIAQQKKNRSVQIEFTQTRTLPTLKRPQTHDGQLWFQSPDHFRWQLGEPPELIVLKRSQDLHAIFPAKQKAHQLDTSPTAQGPASEFSMMLRYPIADSVEAFQLQFEVLAMAVTAQTLTLTLRPRDPQARKWVKQMTFQVERTHGIIEQMDLDLKTGARLVTQVKSATLNTALDPALFQYDLSAYQITQP